jgi:hypothetical protein
MGCARGLLARCGRFCSVYGTTNVHTGQWVTAALSDSR